MKLLAIDTSTEACSAALYLDGVINARYQIAPREHAALILTTIDTLLRESAITLPALDALAFGRGPGSFTGLRIAAGVIQGLAYGAGRPVVPVSSLAALAVRAWRERGATHVLATLDARIDEVYWGAYQVNRHGLPTLKGEEVVCAPEHVPRPPPGTWFGAGSGWGAYDARLKIALGQQEIEHYAGCYPHAEDVARLAVDAFHGGLAVDAAQALPVYLRDDVARRMASQ